MQVLPNLSLLKGTMSDKDIEFIKLSASALSLDMSEQAFIENITEIRQKLEEQLGIVSHFNNQQVQVEDWYGSGSIMENTDLSDFPQ